ISLATVTPSLVMSGEPNDLSMMTLRPLGPRVTFTASARVFTPFRMALRPSWSNLISFAAIDLFLLDIVYLLVKQCCTAQQKASYARRLRSKARGVPEGTLSASRRRQRRR